METKPRRSLASQLRSSVERLAARGVEQVAWVERQGVHADELALDFSDAVLPAVVNLSNEFTPELLLRLELLDDQLSSMSGTAKARLWTSASILNDPAWGRVRTLAQVALDAPGWPPL